MHLIGMLIVTAVILFLTARADHFDLGDKAAAEGKVDSAIYHYTEALEKSELSRQNQARVLNNRAIAYFQKGLYAKALKDLDLAIQLSPLDLEITRNRQTTAQMSAGGTAQPLYQAASASEFPGGMRRQERIKLFGLL